MAGSDVPYLPVDDRGWRMAMGLRPLEPGRWLEVDAQRDEQLALKRDLLASSYDVVTAVRPAGDAACAELLGDVVTSLRRDHSLDVTPAAGVHPLVAAALSVQEDLCVMVRSDEWRLEAASVCFPSRWRLAEKIGATLDEIHGPVPLYDPQLRAPTNAFFDRVRSERSFWRLNWTLLDSPALHQPTASRRRPAGDLGDWYFRVERQTLRRLATSGAVVFTIRTYVDNALALSQRYEGFAAALLHSLETAPASVQEYKGWVGLADQLRATLSTS